MRPYNSLRWVAVVIFVLSAVINYLDRLVLATMVDIWRTRPEFPFSYSDYGLLLSVFSLAYALSAPLMGLFLDRVGLNRGMSWSVAMWAGASIATGFVHNLHQLLLCRAILGIAEASAIAGTGKAYAMYLEPRERAVGAAVGQMGLSIGAGLAPRFAVFFAYNYDWRWAFFAAGILSLLWIPVWLATWRAIPPAHIPPRTLASQSAILMRDPKLWAIAIANGLSMTIYMLWMNWTPTYLIRSHHLTPPQAANYSWMVPICGYIGAFAGGSLSWRFIARGSAPVAARKRVCLLAAIAALATATLPLMPTPALSTLGMSFSFFCISAWSTNLYTIPVDLYGPQGAAFSTSALVFAYGIMGAIISKPLGHFIEQHGFESICIGFAFLPLLAYAVLSAFVRTEKVEDPPLVPQPARA